MKRALTFALTLIVSTVWLVPSATPSRGIAEAQTPGAGVTVSGDFRGNGRAQLASLYDAGDDLGLRISVIERGTAGETFTASEWFVARSGDFDLSRMKVVATDANLDGRTDLVALYDDGGTSVRLLVWLSTGGSFTFAGTAGWWQSSGYAWSRTKAVLAGNFSAQNRSGLLFIYQYDNYQMRIHYLESDGKQFIYNGNQGVYDSGPGQYDTARARFAIGRFTRTSGPDQIASIYQYPNYQIKIHVFDPTPTGLQPVNGWDGVWASAENTYDIARAKFVATDVDGDGKTDVLGFYWYADGSVRVHQFSGAKNLALIDTTGIAQFAPFTMPWLETRVVAGDFDGDRKGDLVTLTAFADGTTHVGSLRSAGAQLAWTSNVWVSAAATAPQRCSGCWPLNGLPASGSPLLARRTLAVKIDNAPTARPHYGTSQADIMVELLVEGFITRLAAYFHSQDPGTIGAVRSIRASDRYTTPMVRGVLVASGASQTTSDNVYRDLANGNYVVVSPQFGEGFAFFRTNVDGRVAPHNLFTTGAALRQGANNEGGGAPVSVPSWDFMASVDHTPSAGGFMGSVGTTRIEIPYRADARVHYEYSAASRTYARWQNDGSADVREVDAANGAVIAARNVVIIQTEITPLPIIEDAGGSPSFDMRLTGMGNATVFRDGRRQDGVWYRGTWFDPFIFVSSQGERILLSPGQTWIHIIPTDWQVPSS